MRPLFRYVLFLIQPLHLHFLFSLIPTCSSSMLRHFIELLCLQHNSTHNCSGLDRSDAVAARGGGGAGGAGGGAGGGEGGAGEEMSNIMRQR